ncbi:TPA: hypothetical protein HJJ11_001286 [Escherichia coli]|nr:hypothetical protein [Escherichia coli]
MLQHYSVSWKKGLTALCLLAVAGLSGCDQKENAAAKVEYDGLSNSQPLRVDANNHTVTMLVQINGRFLTDDTRHGIVFKDGSNGHKSLFMGYATPKAFYEALKEAGGTPGENMTMDNKETTHVTGSKLDISVNWQGAAKAYSPPMVDDALRVRLATHFDAQALTELTALIGLQNLSARFNSAMDIPAQGLCRIPDKRS